MNCRILQIPEMKGALGINEKNFTLKMARKDKKEKQKNKKKSMKMLCKLLSNYCTGCLILRYLSFVEFSHTDCGKLTKEIIER